VHAETDDARSDDDDICTAQIFSGRFLEFLLLDTTTNIQPPLGT
jgi:hypothetical protein